MRKLAQKICDNNCYARARQLCSPMAPSPCSGKPWQKWTLNYFMLLFDKINILCYYVAHKGKKNHFALKYELYQR